MSYATILVHVQNEDAAQPRLECACALAARFEAKLFGVGAEMMRTMSMDDGISSMGAEWFKEMRDIVETNLDRAARRFEAASADLSKGAMWERGLELPGRAMDRSSRAADLIVASTGPDGRNDPYSDAAPADLVLGSGRPVLVVPQSPSPLSARRVLLAWKDGREARRAMSDAMPFFEGAEAVLVLALSPKDEAEAAKDGVEAVAGALQRHGAAAEGKVVVEPPADASVIMAQAKAFRADLIVAGAYGHSRLGEWVFGGVTRDLLGQRDCHVLLSH
jgi:nucleotide-binding universal stress UspA family protein